MDFKNKVVIVTGSSAGVGASIVKYFANLSAKVVIVGRNEERLNEVARACEDAKGIKPLVIKADITVDADVQRIVNETVQQFGKIDVLVNNAGVGAIAGIRDGIQHLDKALSTNLRSAYLLTGLVVPYLVQTQGNIVNISSVASIKATTGFLPYSISKAALDMFTKCLAKELAADKIRVNSVNPGPVKNDFLLGTGMNHEQMDQVLKDREATSPLGKIVTNEEVADLVVYLASDKARSITGSIYFIENGYLLT